MKRVMIILLVVALLAGMIPTALAADTRYVYDGCIIYTVHNNKVTIVDYLSDIPEEVTIPAEINGMPVDAIGSMAFENCTQMKTIHLPEGLLDIGTRAFNNSGLTGFLEIPSTVRSINHSAFLNTPLCGFFYHGKPLSIGDDKDLRFIIMTDEWFERIGYSMGKAGYDRIFLCESEARPDILTGHFTQQDGITYLVCDQYSYLLRGVDQQSVVLPDAVEGKTVRWIMDRAFEQCRQLQSIQLPNGLERIRRIAFGQTGLQSVALPASCRRLDEYCFQYTSDLKTVDLSNVEYIGDGAFQHSGLQTVVLAGQMEHLGGEAFSFTDLREGVFPAGIKDANYTYSNCVNLETITLPEGITKVNAVVSGCPLITELHLPSTVTEIYGVVANTNITSIEIPGGVKTLHKQAFGSENKLQELKLNEGLELIEEGAFSGCSSLTELRLPASVTLVQSVPAIENLCVYFHTGTRFDLSEYTEPTIRFINVDTGEEVPVNLRVTEDGMTFMIRIDHAELISVNRKDDVLTIPDTVRGVPVTIIEKDAIKDLPCSELILPETVELIRPLAISNCKNLYGVTLPASLSAVEDENGQVNAIAAPASETYFTYIVKAGTYGEAYANQLLDQIAEPMEGELYYRILVYEDENPYLAYGNHIFQVEDGEATLLYAIRRDDTRAIDRVPGYVDGIPVTAVADEAYQYSGGHLPGTVFKTVVFNPPLERIGERLFYYDRAVDIYIPDTVTEIADNAFSTLPDRIHGHTGTYAEAYAAAHGDIFENMELPFLDVPSDKWFYKPIRYCYQAGYMSGVSNDLFGPQDTVSRAMLVQVLYSIAGDSMHITMSPDYVPPFTDVKPGKWYYEAIRWAAYYNIVSGTSETTFSPTSSITRQQVAAVLYRFARGAGLDHGERADLNAFSDHESISAYARDAMSWAVAVGMISGYTDETVRPKGTTTRAQLAAMIMHFAALLYAND